MNEAIAACHRASGQVCSPLAFGDTQPIAIGIDNNLIVGPHRTGPRNQRRTPLAVNTALYPTLMWNSRFAALSGDPFDNSAGFHFPPPEDLSLSDLPHLLVAQAFIPPTERVEVAGFAFPGDNDDIRSRVLRRLNASHDYRQASARRSHRSRREHSLPLSTLAKRLRSLSFHPDLRQCAARPLRPRPASRPHGEPEKRCAAVLREGRVRAMSQRGWRVQ